MADQSKGWDWGLKNKGDEERWSRCGKGEVRKA